MIQFGCQDTCRVNGSLGNLIIYIVEVQESQSGKGNPTPLTPQITQSIAHQNQENATQQLPGAPQIQRCAGKQIDITDIHQ